MQVNIRNPWAVAHEVDKIARQVLSNKEESPTYPQEGCYCLCNCQKDTGSQRPYPLERWLMLDSVQIQRRPCF